MKLLFTQDALVNAGAERSHLEILSRFSSEVDVGFVYFYPKHELKEAYVRAGIRLFFLDIPESYHFWLAVTRLVKLIRTEKPDLLVSSLWRADIITRMASWITGVPLVGTLVNDSYSPMAWKDKQGLKYRLVYWLDRLTAGIPIHWIANAHALAESHVKTLGIKPERISVVYRGRPVIASPPVIASEARAKQSPLENENSMKDRFVPRDDESPVIASEVRAKQSPLESENSVKDRFVLRDDESPVIAREARPKQSQKEETASAAESTEDKAEFSDTSLPPQRAGAVTRSLRNFISYGRLLERKGFQDAIRAFSQVVSSYPDCTLTIFGEGPYRRELEKLILDLGLQESVFLPGKVQNPVDLLNSDLREHRTSFHCFLFPSWYEGFSGALVEAMMAGIPIIASDIPMNLEAIEADKSALVFPVGNVGALADQLLFAIQNPERMEELGKEARKVGIQNFDIEVIAKEYEEVLRGI